LATAALISSRPTVSAPFNSPSYSISNLPVMDGSAAYTSLTRATAQSSRFISARRSAFETTFSIAEIGSRWLTPERLSMRRSCRAWNAISSTTSATKVGTSVRGPTPSRVSHASWAVIAIASPRPAG
jgi:hypothetical protein